MFGHLVSGVNVVDVRSGGVDLGSLNVILAHEAKLPGDVPGNGL